MNLGHCYPRNYLFKILKELLALVREFLDLLDVDFVDDDDKRLVGEQRLYVVEESKLGFHGVSALTQKSENDDIVLSNYTS